MAGSGSLAAPEYVRHVLIINFSFALPYQPVNFVGWKRPAGLEISQDHTRHFLRSGTCPKLVKNCVRQLRNDLDFVAKPFGETHVSPRGFLIDAAIDLQPFIE